MRELIKEIRKHEEQITREIKQDKRGKELWENTRKISGKEVEEKRTENTMMKGKNSREKKHKREYKSFGNKFTRFIRIR